jgi:hypothetical protein
MAGRRTFFAVGIAGLVALAGSEAFAAVPDKTASPTATPAKPEGVTVLFLGDSLALCGFGKRLDAHFREAPEVKATYTYMACATHPLSWLKEKPYTTIKTRCGFWTIESVPGSQKPKEMEDMYGMRRRNSPKSYPVPKLEDLLARIRPDVLVMQTGGNLFDLFPDKKTVRPDRDTAALRKFVGPFISKSISAPSTLRKIYWIGPPTSGRVSKPVQDFVAEQVRLHLGGAGMLIDSRSLVAYPYRHMEPDHEHFQGEDMDEWADKVFAIIHQDLSSQRLPEKLLSESLPSAAPSAVPAPAEPPATDVVEVSARLVHKSKPMRVEEFLPYQESLVGFVYDVKKVSLGQYTEKQILVMHPAYIGLKKQPLRKYRIGHTYKLRVRELERTPWSTIKRKDDSGLIDLQPYIQVEDENKFPETTQPK